MMCSNCGVQNAAGSSFCANCGKPLTNNEVKYDPNTGQPITSNVNNTSNINNTASVGNNSNLGGTSNVQVDPITGMPIVLNNQSNPNTNNNVQTANSVNSSSKGSGIPKIIITIAIVLGVFTVISIVIVIIIFVLLSSKITDTINASDRLVCTTSKGDVTIAYDEDGVTGYTETGGYYDFDLDEQQEMAEMVGIEAYLDEMEEYFEDYYGGTCTRESGE